MLRRPLEPKQYASCDYRFTLDQYGFQASMRRKGNCWDTQLGAALDRLAQQAAPSLVARFGIDAQTAATLLVTAGDNPERLRNDAALAALCGVSPLEASSSKVIRHRLNRGGDRQANNALWTIAIVRMRSEPRMRAYVKRRTQEGHSTKEIYRCLKRYIMRELYPLIIKGLQAAGAAP
ncbi:transposase [Chromohalobacter israelensis]|uniref:transposase n=1 Tax=Chromohalobacter israelensis TaxID=141390 RepID=UPI00351CBC08